MKLFASIGVIAALVVGVGFVNVQSVFASGAYFTATWCGPCQVNARNPEIQQLLKTSNTTVYENLADGTWKVNGQAASPELNAKLDTYAQQYVETYPNYKTFDAQGKQISNVKANDQDAFKQALKKEIASGNPADPNAPADALNPENPNTKSCYIGPTYTLDPPPPVVGMWRCNTLTNQLYSDLGLPLAQFPIGYKWMQPGTGGIPNPACPLINVNPVGDSAVKAADMGAGATQVGKPELGTSVKHLGTNQYMKPTGSHTVPVGGEPPQTQDGCDLSPAPADAGKIGPFQGLGGQPGGAGGGGLGGLGGGAGLESLLPLLLGSLLGGGQQGQGQGGQGSGLGNGGTGLTDCSTQGVYPVCGSDGKTYNNTCWLQQYGAVQTSIGVCTGATVSPQPTPNINQVSTQLVTSGMPQSLIGDMLNKIKALVASLRNPSVVFP